MKPGIINVVNKRYPQNYILRNPLMGTLIFFIFFLAFTTLYKPFEVHPSPFLSFRMTMAAYAMISSLLVFVFMIALKRIPYFSGKNEWTFLKEFASVLLILLWEGIVVYLLGFLLESPAQRLNFPTFLDSCKIAMLIGIIPFAFFSLSNFRYLLLDDVEKNFDPFNNPSGTVYPPEEIIQISSRLKKEELSFYPNQFIYAESDGNYVIFYLEDGKDIRKDIIRNSISNIEQQLSPFPHFIRTHRAFIVNLKKIKSIKGNTLGYRLRLPGTDSIIPVSRQNIAVFDECLKQLR